MNAPQIAPLDLAQFQSLTAEDIAINRAVAKRIGNWKWLDYYQPTGRMRIAERAIGMSGSRVGFANFVRYS